MKNILLKIWGFLLGSIPYVYVVILSIIVLNDFKTLNTNTLALRSQLEDVAVNQANVYASTIELDQLLTQVVIGLNDKVEQNKLDAIKQANAIIKTIYAVDKNANARDQGIVDGVNKVVTDVNYVLQKPSYDYLKSITVRLIAKNKDPLAAERGWMGTGLIIAIDKDFTYILTNRHVVGQYGDGTHDYYVKDGDDKYTLTALKISKDEGVDLALVRINGHIDGKKAVVGFGTVHEQDSVYMVGMDLGRPFFYSEGTVSGFDPEDGDELVVGMPVGPGNSGSGVINKNGELVGLLYAGSIISQEGIDEMDIAHGLCVPIKAIRLFLAGYIEQ